MGPFVVSTLHPFLLTILQNFGKYEPNLPTLYFFKASITLENVHQKPKVSILVNSEELIKLSVFGDGINSPIVFVTKIYHT